MRYLTTGWCKEVESQYIYIYVCICVCVFICIVYAYMHGIYHKYIHMATPEGQKRDSLYNVEVCWSMFLFHFFLNVHPGFDLRCISFILRGAHCRHLHRPRCCLVTRTENLVSASWSRLWPRGMFSKYQHSHHVIALADLLGHLAVGCHGNNIRRSRIEDGRSPWSIMWDVRVFRGLLWRGSDTGVKGSVTWLLGNLTFVNSLCISLSYYPRGNFPADSGNLWDSADC